MGQPGGIYHLRRVVKVGNGCDPMSLLFAVKNSARCFVWSACMLVIAVLSSLSTTNAEPVYQHGVATWHDPSGSGLRTASKRRWAGNELIAAHRTLPLGSKIRVVNLANQRSVVVEIRDRGPYLQGRIIDVSRRAAKELGLLETGIAKVRLEPVSLGHPPQG